MTTAAASGAGTAPASTPAPIVDLPDGGFSDESLSASEEAYFESGGEKLDGLDGGDEGQGQETDTGKEPAKAPAKDAKDPDGEAAEGADGAEPAAGTKAADTRPKTVPHAALHEERENHKTTRAERQAAVERAAAAEAKLSMLWQSVQAWQERLEASKGQPEKAA